jgi:phosphatidate cytidylyltransferase
VNQPPPLPPTHGRGAFASRAIVATLALGTFGTLAWADATGFQGAPPAWWLMPLALILALGSAAEAARLCNARGLVVRSWLVQAATFCIVLAPAVGTQAFAARDAGPAPVGAMGWAAVACGTALGAMFLAEIAGYRRGGGSIDRLAAGFLIATAIGLPVAFMVGLRLVCVENLGPEARGPGHAGLLPLVSLVAVVKAGDVAAYVMGSLVGRHRMAPTLSPGKTWEGAVASLLAALAAAWLVIDWWAVAPWRPWGGWPVFGLVVGLSGTAGDLAESLVKRESGAKDSGRSLGGLGGFLDLVDSPLFAAPVAWLLWVLGRWPAG